MVDSVLDGVDVLDPPKKIVYVAGEAFDFTFVPTRITMKSLRVMDQMKNGTISEVDGMDQIIEVIAEQASRTNPKITADWILDNTSIAMIEKMSLDLAGVAGETQENSSDSAKNLPLGE